MRAKDVSVLLLAAGASRRMRGRDKLLEPVAGGMALLRERAQSCLALHPREVLVTLPDPPGPRGESLAGLPVCQVLVADAAEGMAASLRRGLSAIADKSAAVLVVLADMPDLRTQDMVQVISESDGAEIFRGASVTGAAGHPVLFPRALVASLRQLRGDAGAGKVLASLAGVHLVRLPRTRALTDLDTPEDWARWRETSVHSDKKSSRAIDSGG